MTRSHKKKELVSKTLKSMVRLVIFWNIEQQIQKEFVRVPRRYTRVILCSSAMLRDFHIYFVHSPCRVWTPLHCFHANSVAKWQLADRFPMSPCVDGPWAHKTGRFKVLRLPGASTGIWLYDHSVTPKHHDSKRKGHGTRAYAVYMQFLWTAEGAIKILQINYIKKKKKANYLYTKFVQDLHFAVIICTNSAGAKKENGATQYQKIDPNKLIIWSNHITDLHSWPVHLRQCLLLWSSHLLLHQSASLQGLSSHGAAQQHWCIHCHPENDKKF